MPKTMKVQAFGYIRTSSATNFGEDKDSDKRQRAAIQGYADRSAVKIIDWFYDVNIMGSDPIETRPGFGAMLERIAGTDTGLRTVIVESADRFARDLMVQEIGFEFLRREGITLIAADRPAAFLDDSPMAVAFRQMLGVMAQFEKSMIVAKLKSARDRKSALLGRRCDGRKPAPDAVIAMARSIRSTGASLRDVSKALAQAGHLSPSGRPYLAGSIAAMVRSK